MQVALVGQEEWLAPSDIYWHIPLPRPRRRQDNIDKSVDDKIAKAFFVAMGIVGVALVVLTVKIAVTKK